VIEQHKQFNLWHERYGHLNERQLNEIVRNELVTGMNVAKTGQLSFCEGCVTGKLSRKPFKPIGEICSTRKLQLVHSDIHMWSTDY